VKPKRKSIVPSVKDNLDMANGCLNMVRTRLEALGTNMDATPPMFYEEAIQSTVVRYAQATRSGIAARLRTLADEIEKEGVKRLK
jgi:hypothetical protein